MILLHKNDLSAPTIQLILEANLAWVRASSPGRCGGGKGKGSRACNYVSGILIPASKKAMRNADWRRWHSNDVIALGTCFSMYVYIRARFRFMLIGGNLTAQTTRSHRGIGGGIQIPETKGVVASLREHPVFSAQVSPTERRERSDDRKYVCGSQVRRLRSPFPTPQPKRSGELAHRLKQIATTQIILPEYCSFPISAYMTVNRSNVRFVIGCASP